MITSDVLASPGISHGFFGRQGGHSSGLFASLNCGLGSGDDLGLVRRNRAIVAEQLGTDEPHLVTAFQHHSADVITVRDAWPVTERPKADGLVTDVPGLALGVLTADCGPVLFAEPDAGIIGAAHAGWKGALTGVTDSTIEAMVALGARREKIHAVIGPTISRRAYEVGPEFPGPFLAADPSTSIYFRAAERPGHFMFNLPGYLLRRLEAAGIGLACNLDLCTFSDEQQFFSYRRATHRKEGDYGRQIAAISLR
jgi:YfiH family protein